MNTVAQLITTARQEVRAIARGGDNWTPPYFFRRLYQRPPEDWPVKGTRANTVGAQRLAYVRRGLRSFYADYVAGKQPGEARYVNDLLERERRQMKFEEVA